MADDLRQRYAEALAAKFTEPIYRCDRDGENERVENPEPADRIGQTPYVMVTAGDGCRSFWTPSCAELGEVVAAVRDDEMERLRQDLASATSTLTELAPDSMDAWRERAEKAELVIARAENLRDKWLAWPPDDMHHAAGLMLSKYLDGTAYGSDEPRPAALNDQETG